MVPQVLSLIQRGFEGVERTRALSQYSAILSLGVAAGQVVGGILVSADLAGSTWRAVFLVNVPAGMALLVAARRHLPSGRAGARGFDVAGMLTLGVAMLLLVVPLALGREMGWPAWSLACLALAAPALALFVAVERAAAGTPLVDLSLLGDRVVTFGLAAIVAVMAGFAAFVFMFTLHLQAGLGYSPLRSSLTFVPYALGFGTASLNWRRLPASWHAWISPAGFAVLAGADGCWRSRCGPRAAAFRRWSWSRCCSQRARAPLAAFAPLAVAVTARTRADQASSLSGVVSTGTTLAAVVGVAVGGGAYLSAAATTGSAHAFQVVAVGLAAAMLASGVAALEAGGSGARSRIAHMAAGRRGLRSGPS